MCYALSLPLRILRYVVLDLPSVDDVVIERLNLQRPLNDDLSDYSLGGKKEGRHSKPQISSVMPEGSNFIKEIHLNIQLLFSQRVTTAYNHKDHQNLT